MDQNQEHELKRERLARQAYINWRMRDLPPIYQDLMPYSYRTLDLWRAEKAIRAQLEADVEHLRNPWRQLGPVASVFDDEGMEALDLIAFGLEVLIPPGMPDVPKPGAENHPDVVKAQKRAMEESEEYRLYAREQELRQAIDDAPDQESQHKARNEYYEFVGAHPEYNPLLRNQRLARLDRSAITGHTPGMLRLADSIKLPEEKQS